MEMASDKNANFRKRSQNFSFGNTPFMLLTRTIPGNTGILLKIGWTPLGPLALFTFCDIFELAALKKRLQFDFPAAGTNEFLSGGRCAGVFTCLTHDFTP
jgi:hypothetical protein